MQAITTKYIGPSNVKDSRIKAWAAAGSITLNWDNSLSPDNNHKAAALALATKMGWNYGEWISGGDPRGYSVWVCNVGDRTDKFTVAKAA